MRRSIECEGLLYKASEERVMGKGGQITEWNMVFQVGGKKGWKHLVQDLKQMSYIQTETGSLSQPFFNNASMFNKIHNFSKR